MYSPEVRQLVLNLLEAGVPPCAIAKKTGITTVSIRNWRRENGCKAVVRRGRLPKGRASPPRRVYQKPPTAADWQEIDQVLAEERQRSVDKGDTDWASRAAKRTGWKKYLMRRRTTWLLSRGKLPSIQGNNLRGHGRPSKLQGKRWEVIEQAVREDWTLQQIGDRLGFTRERARQVRRDYLLKVGKDITRRVGIAKLKEQAGRGVCFSHIEQAISQLKVDYKPRRGIRPEYVTDVVATARLLAEQFCQFCGKAIPAIRYRRKYCSRQCAYKATYRGYRQSLPPASIENTRGWQQEAVVLLAKSRVSKPTFVEAELGVQAGLTAIQLWWASRRGLVRHIPHPTRRGAYRRYSLYALEDMLTCAQAKKDYYAQQQSQSP